MKFINFLNEAGLTLGGVAYPKYNNILILAGGAGSGKGFVTKNFILFDGKTFDVDELKTGLYDLSKTAKGILNNLYDEEGKNRVSEKFDEYMKAPTESKDLRNSKERCKGLKIKQIDFKNVDHVSILHGFASYLGIDDVRKNALFTTAKDRNNKPNVIFDVTLKKLENLEEIWEYAQIAGYDPKNIHLVWILNDIEIARIQNKQRSRTVSDEVLSVTHEGAFSTISSIYQDFMSLTMKNGKRVCDVIDGDIWIVPNKAGVDSALMTKDAVIFKDGKLPLDKIDDDGKLIQRTPSGKIKKLVVLKAMNKYQLKERGKHIKSLDQMEKDGFYIIDSAETVKYKDISDVKVKKRLGTADDIISTVDSYTPEFEKKVSWNKRFK